MADPALLLRDTSVQTLFWTPVLAEMWPGAPLHNAALKAAIARQAASVAGVAKSNIHGWQSDISMTAWGGAAADALVAHAAARANAYTAGGPIDWVPEMWANVSRRGASNQTHAHPGSVWSAVYYVDDGYAGSSDKAVAGELSFLDPRFPAVRMAAPELRHRRPDGTIDNQEVWLRPRTGLFVLFPSWLLHAVRPYAGQGTRTSIAINLVAPRG
ncbi:2OG-Fe(II) oxygenase family protein [Sphingomonas floccifaciens]|uniref:2OG-Fe(II) oxygenase family protein n=1 Tax=Sphingomonas floccifaciens TaxID=1844115 RepID=A0ABW4NES6_9SPHN